MRSDCYGRHVSVSKDFRLRSVCLVVLAGALATCRAPPPSDPPIGPVDAGSDLDDIDDVVDPAALVRLVSRGDAVVARSGPLVPDDLIPRPPETVAVADLGPLMVGDDGSTGSFFVDVDARVRALTLVVVGEPDDVVVPTRIVAPSGRVVVDGAPLPDRATGHEQIEGLSRGFTGQWVSPGRVLAAVGVGAFAVPSSPDVPLEPGRWAIQVGRFTVATDDDGDPVPVPRSGAVRVFVLLRGARVDSGSVGIAFHYSGASGLTATTAPSSAALVATQMLLQDALGSGDVDVDDVIHLDLPDAASHQLVVVEMPRCEGPELDALARLGVPDRLNVFIVDAIECGNVGPFLMGFATGQPMVPWARSPRGGVVIAASLLADDPELFALTVTHELGHLMGLFHSQENDRFGVDLYDHIADTPDDEGARRNLMFFNVSRVEDAMLTPGQGRVMQAMPMVLP